MSKTVLFQTIKFSISTQNTIRCYRKYIGPYQVLPLRAKMDVVVMGIKGFSAFPKIPVLLKPHHHIF